MKKKPLHIALFIYRNMISPKNCMANFFVSSSHPQDLIGIYGGKLCVSLVIFHILMLSCVLLDGKKLEA
jgi:hypothetical protein